jgi:IS5 family transposase
VATKDTVTKLISSIRRVRRVVPGAERVSVYAHDYDTSGKPLIAWDDPVAKAALVDGLVTDALALLGALEATTTDSEATAALGLLALVAGQDVEQDDDGTWKIAQRVAPDRVISTVDTEARHMRKSRSEYRDGYKAHIAVEPETGLITAAALTAANASDAKTAPVLIGGEAHKLEILADSAYGSGELRAELRTRKHRQLIKPIPLRRAVPGGYDRDDFSIDHAAGTATCPAGITVAIPPSRRPGWRSHCPTCSLRTRCTKAKDGMQIELHPHDDELSAARRQWKEGEGLADYRRFRPMVERSIAWLVADGHRRVRFRGVERNQLGLSLRVAALNLRRLVNLGLVNDGAWSLKVS